MSREVDRRDNSINRVTPARENELRSRAAAFSDRLPGSHRVLVASFNPNTGNPTAITSEGAPAEDGNYVNRAMDHVRGLTSLLGFAAGQPKEYQPDPGFQTTSSGAVAVHLQQRYKGISIFQAAETVRFEPNGAIQETVGSSITVQEDTPVSGKLTAEEAVLKAAQHVAVPDADEDAAKDQFGEPMDHPRVDLTGFAPKIVATFAEKPERLTVLEAGPFGDETKARLLWFPIDDALRLTWEVLLTMPEYRGQYRTLVDADTGEILYCRQLLHSVIGKGNVFQKDGSSSRQLIDFPKPLTDYGIPVPTGLPATFPDHWVIADRTSGNCATAHLGDSGASGTGAIQNGSLVFNPSNATGDDQKVLNIFYYNCVMHDFFYLLGFREQDGNFQRDNLGRGGLASDSVDARAHSGAVFGTANMGTPVDGLGPVMNMGLVTSTNRHTAFDSSVVFHEFTHGVSNRLVGGPADERSLDAQQSGGMGEGWSDYIACSVNDSIVVGDWVVDSSNGIRKFKYDSNFPDHFGKLGTGRYDEVHNIGEIWCATLMEMNRNIGKVLGLQLVVDGFKLTPANPSFLDARDGILRALENKASAGQLTPAQADTARQGFWKAFAKFGMGPGARSNGATLSGIVADFNLPATAPTGPASGVKVEGTPNLAIPDNKAAGISHVLSVPKNGRIKRLTVAVDIQHPFIGDLEVSLTSPAGKLVVLHNRAGGSQDNLVKAYRSEDIPGLASLLGDAANGNWKLNVADRASSDVGTLRSWSLEMDVEDAAGQTVHQESAPGLAIPDNAPAGISNSIAISQAGTVKGLKLSVDITHGFIGDLSVALIAPSGQEVLLHDRSGGSDDNLIRNFDSVTSSVLLPLVGQQAQGNWTLRVRDLAAQDVGKLNRWSLDLSI